MMPNDKQAIDDRRLLAKGFGALIETLGPSGAIRFVRLCEHEVKDYTKERHKWLGELTPEEIESRAWNRKGKRWISEPAQRRTKRRVETGSARKAASKS